MNRLRYRFAALLCLTLGALAALQSCSNKPHYAAVPKGTVVLAFGDSVTHGTGAGEGEDYPTQLAKLTGWEIRNYGVPGDTAATAKERIADALAETEPGLVIVELGGNDFLRRFPAAQVKEDLRVIVRAAKAGGRPVVLVAVPEFSILGASFGSLTDAAIYSALAEEEKVVLVAGVFSGVLEKPALKSDQIHPNSAGYRVLASGIAQALHDVGLVAE